MIEVIPYKHPKSPESIVEMLRDYLDLAINEKIVYMEITYKKFGDRTVYTEHIAT